MKLYYVHFVHLLLINVESFYIPQIIKLQYKTIQYNKTIYCVHSKHELIHSNELARLTGKTDRQELANHKKVAQFLPSDRLLRPYGC